MKISVLWYGITDKIHSVLLINAIDDDYGSDYYDCSHIGNDDINH